MLCCKRKKHDYDVANEEEIDAERSKDSKVDNLDNKTGAGKTADIESPIEVTVTEVTEAIKQSSLETAPEQNGRVKKSEDQSETGESGERTVEGKFVDKGDKKDPKYVSQMSVSSSLSIREEINRSREQFFSNSSLNEFNLQEEISKRYSATEEKFAEHQRRVRDRIAQRKAGEQIMSAEEMQLAVSRLEAVAARLESLAVSGVKTSGSTVGTAPSGAPEVTAPFVTVFDGILKGEFAKFMELSGKIGGEVQAQANMVKSAFQDLREFLVVASKSKKPAPNVLQELLNPMSQHISAIQEFREKNRTCPNFNHLSAISEAIPALGWVAVEPTPGPFVKDMQEAGVFYTNRVLKDYKEKDQTHVDWAKAWNGIFREMITYIKDNHTTGVSWNPQTSADAVSSEEGGDATASSKPAAGGAPPPPPPGPPPPPPPAPDAAPAQDGGADTHAALFAEINRGTAISSGLKKVTDDMKTHKNPSLRAASTVTSSTGVRAGPAPFKAAAPPKPAPKPGVKAAPVTKPPVLELQDKKWMVEYQVGNKTMVIDDTNIKQAVYMFKCQDSTLQVKGKINSIILDNCKKVAVAFDDVVSSIEFVNCQSVQAQVMGKCPTVSIEKTDGCMMYLSKDSLNAEIVTAKSSEMNILVPKGDGDYDEFPLPEQFKSTWNGKKFSTECTDSV